METTTKEVSPALQYHEAFFRAQAEVIAMEAASASMAQAASLGRAILALEFKSKMLAHLAAARAILAPFTEAQEFIAHAIPQAECFGIVFRHTESGTCIRFTLF